MATEKNGRTHAYLLEQCWNVLRLVTCGNNHQWYRNSFTLILILSFRNSFWHRYLISITNNFHKNAALAVDFAKRNDCLEFRKGSHLPFLKYPPNFIDVHYFKNCHSLPLFYTLFCCFCNGTYKLDNTIKLISTI